MDAEPGHPPESSRLLSHPALLLAGIVLASLNMRGALASMAPLVGDVSAHFGLSSTVSSLVTSVPVLFLGLGSMFAPRLSRRFGTEQVLFAALTALAAGIVVRSLSSVVALFAGSILLGTAIALLNVLMPGLIKRDFPHRAASMTSLYTCAMVIGASTAAGVSVPLEKSFGGSWQAALAFWALPAAVAAAVWFPQVVLERRSRSAPAATAISTTGHQGRSPGLGKGLGPDRVRDAGVWRSTLAWQVTCFMGLQSLLVYVVIAWMPTILTDHGMSKSTAGVVFAVSNLIQVVGAFVFPLLAARMRNQGPLVAVAVALTASGYVGLLVNPVGGAWAWAALLGVGQGGAVGLALTMIVLRSRDAYTAARLSGLAQGVGYLLAASGPLAAGALYQSSGGWTAPIVLMLLLCGAQLAAGLGAARDRKL
ncbi:MFS transporter [Streptomyces sp. H10-C2]|uniref:CynX/NimT family MFS transporter n=1 Tax=unclassified Streptomyces TaxID=2593676 RepID=UPI0024BA5903|nr:MULTISPECIES: MFS transporter [unclassified Streptomyces]MDJ0342067.1 MFS transporter [Streptomyces sp. PH10-H1]MDJ0368409.1 MFS transporter [Streptomyces sp. H10-C2]